jgi:RNA polymerase sigma-70 factor, ECF subfamily
VGSGGQSKEAAERKKSVTNLQDENVTERFLEQGDEDSFGDLFRVFSPQLVSFFRRRGHETGVAEDLAQEVMLTVYRKAGQLRDHKSFRAWLFKVARNAACRHFAQRSREVPTVDLADVTHLVTAPQHNSFAPTSEFRDWMKFLDEQERETMTLRFVEEWEYHEIAAAQAIPIGTVQWRVFNSKKKLAPHLRTPTEVLRKAA